MPEWNADAIDAFMAESELFAVLPEPVRKALAQAAIVRQIEPGEDVFRRGEEGNSLFVVAEGKVRVSLAGPDGEEEVSQLEPGKVFGEIALLTRSHRTATITATDPATVLELTAEAISPVLEQAPSFKERLGRTGAKRSQESMKKILGE